MEREQTRDDEITIASWDLGGSKHQDSGRGTSCNERGGTSLGEANEGPDGDQSSDDVSGDGRHLEEHDL